MKVDVLKKQKKGICSVLFVVLETKNEQITSIVESLEWEIDVINSRIFNKLENELCKS